MKTNFKFLVEDSTPPSEPYQEVYFDSSGLSLRTGNAGEEEFTLPLFYRISDGSGSGVLRIMICYDSSLLKPVAVDQQFPAPLSGNTFGENLADDSNEDSDESTDKYIELEWADLFGNWGGGTDLKKLGNLKFKVVEGADLTAASTSIRVESDFGPTNPQGINFYGKDLNLVVETSEPAEQVVTEPYQTVAASNDEISFTLGKDINFDLIYTTSDNENALPGLGLKVHYDSTIFTPSADNNGVSALVNTFGDPTINDDTDNLDNDIFTDSYISINWTDFNGNFPGGDLPARLATLNFSSSKEGVDFLTGALKESKINFTSSEPATNYDFLNQSVVLRSQPFNLDVDGDGSVTALGDGMMVIRKLFGTAFAGEALTSKAISKSATRTTTEIHEFIQAGMDEKILDVDGDGSVTALGDGLMVIKKLFRNAFAGDKLTAQSISNDATRTTDEIHEYIAAISDAGSAV